MVTVMGWANILTYSQYLALNKGLTKPCFLGAGAGEVCIDPHEFLKIVKQHVEQTSHQYKIK